MCYFHNNIMAFPELIFCGTHKHWTTLYGEPYASLHQNQTVDVESMDRKLIQYSMLISMPDFTKLVISFLWRSLVPDYTQIGWKMQAKCLSWLSGKVKASKTKSDGSLTIKSLKLCHSKPDWGLSARKNAYEFDDNQEANRTVNLFLMPCAAYSVWEVKVKRIKWSCIGIIGGHSSRDGSHPTLQSDQMTVLQCVSSHVLQCKVKRLYVCQWLLGPPDVVSKIIFTVSQ
jgi:hypothetical protein